MVASGPAAADAVLQFQSDDVSDVPVGTTRIMHSFLANGGDTAATVTRIEITGPDAAHFAFANPAPPCGSGRVCDDVFTIDPAAFQGLDVGCTVDRSADFRATVTVTSDASNSPTTTLIFCDAAGPHFEITPQPLAFATTAIGFRTPPQEVLIRNTGFADVAFRVGRAAEFPSSLDFACRDEPCVLGAGATLAVWVEFAPIRSGAIEEQIVIFTSLGTAPIAVRGTGTGAMLQVEQPGTFEGLNLGATLLGTTTAPGAVRIRNIGDRPLHVAALVPVGAEVSAFAVIGAPATPFDLAPGATAGWQVTCHPVRFGSNFASLVIVSNAGFATFPVTLRCVGAGGALRLPSDGLAFPPTSVGTSATGPLVFQNVGDRPVTITAIDTTDPQFVVAASLPITVAVNGTATVDATFSPVHGGDQFAGIVVTDDGVVPVLGFAHGVGRTGHADLTPEAPDLGPVHAGSSADLLVHLGNHGDQTIRLTSITIGDPGLVSVDGPPPGTNLEPDQSVQLLLRVTPRSAGVQGTTLTFTFDQGPPVVAQVTATGVTSELAVATWDGRPSDGEVDFGRVRMTTTAGGLVSLTNTGTATLHIASCTIIGDPAFSVSPACVLELAPRASADLALAFAPTTLGLHTALLRFTSDASMTMLDVPLAGVGTPRTGCAAGRDSGGVVAWLIGGLLAVRWRKRRRRGERGSTARMAGLALAIAGCGADGAGELEAARRSTLSVTRTGSGGGVVQSLSHEIDCGTRCAASFDDLLHLAATPAAGSVFVGWDGACAGIGTCVVAPAAAPTVVVARFERHHRISIVGDAPSSPIGAEITLDGVRCALPCVRDVLEGTTLALDVFTLARFTGWTGGCTLAPGPCTLTVTADVDLTAHFTTTDRWTVADDVVPSAVTVVDDDPVVAGGDGTDLVVTRYASAGARSWRTRIAVGPTPQIVGLDHDARGSVFVLVHVEDPALLFGALILHKLDGAGQSQWSATIDASSLLIVDPFDPPRATNDALAVAPGGDAIVVGVSATLNSFVRAYAGDGSVHWTQTVEAFPQDVSVDAGGVVTVAGQTPIFDQGQVDRFGPDGSRVAHYDLPPVINDGSFVVRYHAFAVAGDQLVCASADGSGSLALRSVDLATGGAATWFDDLSGLPGKVALRPDGRGNLLMLAEAGVYRMVGREIVSRHGPDHAVSPGGALDLPFATDVAADAHDRVVEVGGWLRPCEPDESCEQGFHVTGFVRVHAR